MVVNVNEDDMLAVGLNCIGFRPERTANHNTTTNQKHFEGAYGLDPNTCCVVFLELQVRDIGPSTIRKPKLPHFLLTLHWLKRCPVEQMSSGLFGYHEDTVRKWVWKYSQAIQALKPYKVNWTIIYYIIIFINIANKIYTCLFYLSFLTDYLD
jgi:hypothetical protein